MTAMTAGLAAGWMAVVAQAATPALPERTLLLQLRCVEEAATAAEPATPVSARDRVVGTARRAPGVTHGTAGSDSTAGMAGMAGAVRSADARPAEPPLLEVRVANGAEAALHWQAPQADWSLSLFAGVATGGTGGTGGSGGTGGPRAPAAIAVLPPAAAPAAWHLLQVQPRWPGGSQPVQATVSARHAAPGGATQAVRTVLALPLGRWTPLARARPEAAEPLSAGCTLQLRARLAE